MPARSRDIEEALKELEREFDKTWDMAGQLFARVNGLCMNEAKELLAGHYGEAERAAAQVEAFLRAIDHVGRVLGGLKTLRKISLRHSESGEEDEEK